MFSILTCLFSLAFNLTISVYLLVFINLVCFTFWYMRVYTKLVIPDCNSMRFMIMFPQALFLFVLNDVTHV